MVLDDVLDNSENRRGKTCWYRMDDVGLRAINDGSLMRSCAYLLLKKYFKTQPYYSDLLDAFTDVEFKMAKGQCHDFYYPQKSYVSK